VGYYYNGMGGTSVYFYLTGTLSFGVQTRTGSWFIGNAFGTTGASLRDNATDTQIGTCTVADTVWLDEAAPAAAEITCTGHFDGQGRDFPVALSLALPTWKDAFYYHGTGHEYHGVYAG
jgi:hypothetical protein